MTKAGLLPFTVWPNPQTSLTGYLDRVRYLSAFCELTPGLFLRADQVRSAKVSGIGHPMTKNGCDSR
jgi:hypothetical protein